MNPEYLYNYVAPRIAVGGFDSYRKDFEHFGFTLNVAFEVQRWSQDYPFLANVPNLQHVPLDDCNDMEKCLEQAQAVRTAVQLLTNAVEDGHCCLVSCYAGRNRSALVVTEYLIQTGMDPDIAIASVRARRKNSLGNEAFVAWLKRPRNVFGL